MKSQKSKVKSRVLQNRTRWGSLNFVHLTPFASLGQMRRSLSDRQKLSLLFLIIFLLFLFLSLNHAKAAGLVPCGGSGEPPCQFCHFFVLVNNIIRWVFTNLIIPVATLMLVIGGLMFIFAGGNPATLSRAKAILTSTIIGVVIIFGAWIIINVIFSQLGVIEVVNIFNPWGLITNCP